MADTKVKGPTEGPSGYGPFSPPSDKDLSAPTKIYPGASKIGRDTKGGVVEGPGCDNLYSKK